MKKSLVALPLIATGLLLSISAASVYADGHGIAHEGTKAYVHAIDGNIVRDSFGGCVRTIHWSQDTAIAACGAKEQVTAVVEKETFVRFTKPVALPTPVEPKSFVKFTKPVALYDTTPQQRMAFKGLFETNSAILTSSAKSLLNPYVTYLKANANKSVKVIGHTDSVGKASSNQRLSLKRANSVKNYLVSQGIAANRIDAVGMGEKSPVANNNTAAGRAENRRVELNLI